MKITVLSVVVLAACLISTRGAELTITGFGSSDKNPFSLTDDLEGQWVGQGTQTTTAIDLTNISNETTGSDGTNGIFSDLTDQDVANRAPVVIGTNTAQMVLTATLMSAVPGVDEFAVSLFDKEGDELDYTFHWSSFASGGATVIADLSNEVGTFDGTVTSYTVNLFDNQNITPDTLSVDFFDLGVEDEAAIPEPSSYALLLLGAGGIALARRRARVLS